MEPSPPAGATPFAAYGLREKRPFRWEVIEPLPTDEQALKAALERVDAQLATIADGSDAAFLHGRDILDAKKRDDIVQARARYERLDVSAAMLFAHECEQTKARYAARCEQLQFDVGDEIQREIQRLERARDGVAVMDRRRMTRKSGNTSSSASQGSSSTNGPSDSGGNNTGYDANGSTEGASSGYHVTEKRRMEVLLSATPIFRQLDKKLLAEEVDADVAGIQEAMPTFLYEGTVCPRGVPGTPITNDEELDEEEERELAELRDDSGGNTFKRRRLMYTADRVSEGQHVVVYRMNSTPRKKSAQNSGGRSRKRGDDEAENARSEIATGVITAATGAHVYLLSADGSFQTIDVDDWKTGRITVHTVDNE